jgi:hypothetical protein
VANYKQRVFSIRLLDFQTVLDFLLINIYFFSFSDGSLEFGFRAISYRSNNVKFLLVFNGFDHKKTKLGQDLQGGLSLCSLS